MERTSNVRVNIIEYFNDLMEIYNYDSTVVDLEYEAFELYQSDKTKFEQWAKDNNIIIDDEIVQTWVNSWME